MRNKPGIPGRRSAVMANVRVISTEGLFLSVILILAVVFVLIRWRLQITTAFYAAARMILQLTAVGMLLHYVFAFRNAWLTSVLLAAMLFVAAWIALRPVKQKRMPCYPQALIAIAVGGLSTLLLIIGGVIRLEPWHEPRYVLPLAGMIFANSMNGVSLAADRFFAETERGAAYSTARNTAFQTALLPITNSFLAAGLVALPGMMTGQILAGVEPMIAIRYQIMVFCMLYGAIGISASLFLRLQKTGRSAGVAK